MKKRLKFKNLLNEAKLLKLGLPLVQRLQLQSDYVDWRGRVNNFWRGVVNEPSAQLSADAALLREIEVDSEREKEELPSNEKIKFSDLEQSDHASSSRCKQEEQLVARTSSVTVQNLTFKLLEDTAGQMFAERLSIKKIDLAQLRALIAEMISKRFYANHARGPPLSASKRVHDREARCGAHTVAQGEAGEVG